MDPNETLRLLRLTLTQMRVDEDPAIRKAHADEAAEYFAALDEWLSKGGASPAAWNLHTTESVRVPSSAFGGSGTVGDRSTSTILVNNIPAGQLIRDVNVTVALTHQQLQELSIFLVSPTGPNQRVVPLMLNQTNNAGNTPPATNHDMIGRGYAVVTSTLNAFQARATAAVRPSASGSM